MILMSGFHRGDTVVDQVRVTLICSSCLLLILSVCSDWANWPTCPGPACAAGSPFPAVEGQQAVPVTFNLTSKLDKNKVA